MIEGRSEERQTVNGSDCSTVRGNQSAETSKHCQDEYLQACWRYDTSPIHHGSAVEDPCHTFLQRYLLLIINIGSNHFARVYLYLRVLELQICYSSALY